LYPQRPVKTQFVILKVEINNKYHCHEKYGRVRRVVETEYYNRVVYRMKFLLKSRKNLIKNEPYFKILRPFYDFI
jgi:hypothetical protein